MVIVNVLFYSMFFVMLLDTFTNVFGKNDKEPIWFRINIAFIAVSLIPITYDVIRIVGK